MKTSVILQARLGSTRLPKKVTMPILNRPMLELQIERIKAAKSIDSVILATTVLPEDDELAYLAQRLGVEVFRGSEFDVLQRYYATATAFKVDNVIRCNADCPLIDPNVIDTVVNYFLKNYLVLDYASNILDPTYPIGMHTEIFKYTALKDAALNSKDPVEREHVTPYIYRRPNIFHLGSVKHKKDLSKYRLTVDYLVDYEVVCEIYEALYQKNNIFTMEEVVDFLDKNDTIFKKNSYIDKKSTV